MPDNRSGVQALAQRWRLITCWLRGHEPDAEDLDWVGRPVRCSRCGLYDAEMGRAAYERFCGKQAVIAWNGAALALVADAGPCPSCGATDGCHQPCHRNDPPEPKIKLEPDWR